MYIIWKHVFLITFLNEHELISFAHNYFQVLLSNTTNSIYDYSLVFTVK